MHGVVSQTPSRHLITSMPSQVLIDTDLVELVQIILQQLAYNK
jgi:hypothetical protein